MAAGGDRWRRHHRVPRRPGLGRRGALPPGPGPPGHGLRDRRRLPARRGRLRPGVLRHQPARGAGHGPAAAAAAGGVLGGLRARRDRPGHPARQPYRRVRRRQLPGLRLGAGRGAGGRRGPPADRQRHQRALRPHRLHPRPGGAGRDPRHRLLVLAGRPALGVPGAAARRLLAGSGRRRDRDGHTGRVRRVQPSARAGGGRPLQVLRRRRRRHRLVRGRRDAARRAALRRTAQRAPGARGRAWFGGEPGRRQQRTDGAQRAGPAEGHPPGPGRRPPDGRPGRRGRGARHGHHPRRPDRGAGPAGHLRPRASRRAAAVVGFAEVEHRAHAGRRGRGRCDQDGDGDAPRRAAADPARGRADPARGLVGGRGGAADRSAGLAGDRRTAPGRRLLLRCQRDQRAHHPGAGAGRGRGRRNGGDRGAGRRGSFGCRLVRSGVRRPVRAGDHRAGPVAAFRAQRRRAARPGRPAAGPAGRRRDAHPPRPRLLPGHHPGGPAAPRGAGRRGPRGLPARPPGAGGRGAHRSLPRARRRHRGPTRLPLHRSGQSAGRDGPRAVRGLPGVRGGVRRGLRGAGPASGPPAEGRRLRGRGRAGPPDRLHPAGAVRDRGGAVPSGRGVGNAPGLPGRTFDR